MQKKVQPQSTLGLITYSAFALDRPNRPWLEELMPPTPSISVVLPTYNCRSLLGAHLRSMEGWLDLIDEVIIVDSRSTDGTLEFLRAELRHPCLRIIVRDRGLYASWNEGIAATSGNWVYISTAGDTINRAQLEHLRKVGERLAADVVVSPPDFVHEDGRPHRDLGWPPSELNRRFGRGRPFVIEPAATQCLAFQKCPQALLGSSASNLYRGEHLRARPFPTEYGVVGDTAWIMRFGHQTRLALTPRRGSYFCIHAKESKLTPQQCVELHQRLIRDEAQRLSEAKQVGPMLVRVLSEQALPQRTKTLWARKRVLWHAQTDRLANKVRWIPTAVEYLWCRLRTKLQERRTWQEMRGQSSFVTHLPE